MTRQEEYLQTLHPKARTGVKMKRDRYNEITDFILQTLDLEKDLTINRLIEKANYYFWDQLKDETGWYIYHVKLDMEARGLLKNERCERTKKIFIVRNHRSKPRKSGAPPVTEGSGEKASEIAVKKMKAKFVELFNDEPLLTSSPGVVSLIGEHTEYTGGYVLQAATDRSVYFAIGPSRDDHSVIYSFNEGEYETISDIESDTPYSKFRLFYAALRQLKLKGHAVPAFNCVFFNDLPPEENGSASPAIACGFVFSLNMLFDLNLSMLQMIRLAQLSKRNKAELKNGIIDHFTTMLARDKNALMLDCRRLTYNYHALDLKEYCMLVCDSGVRHSPAVIDERKAECAEGLEMLKKRYPSINSLREVTIEQLIDNISFMPVHILKRCQYVIQENDRVQLAGKCLDVGKLRAFAQSMYKTHEGLSRLYELSCPEVDFLVEQTRDVPGILGARMMGAAGGCTLNIIHKNSVVTFADELATHYRNKFGLDLKAYVLNTSAGAALLSEEKVA